MMCSDELELERPRVRASFDRAAAQYDRAASLQRRAAERLLVHVSARNIDPVAMLDAGSGTGYGARLLRAQYPDAALLCLDIAHSMLMHAKSEDDEAVSHICADAERLPFRAEAFDLLWSSAMLQWCNDLQRTFAGFQRALAPRGLLAFATFGPRTLAELREAFDDGHTHVSRFPPLDVLESALNEAGFIEIDTEQRTTVIHYPVLDELLRSLKMLGARNATAGRPRGLTGKERWRRVRERYEALRGPQGLPATYELLYVTARKN